MEDAVHIEDDREPPRPSAPASSRALHSPPTNNQIQNPDQEDKKKVIL